MSLFDFVINEVKSKFGFSDSVAGTLLSALLSVITDEKRGGIGGFLESFTKAGLGDVASSWVSTGANTALSDEQVESALGTGTIGSIAEKVGIPNGAATSALGYMVPQVIDTLTPDGVVPENKDLLSKIGDFLSGWGGAAVGAVAGAAGIAGAVAGGAADKVGGAANATVNAVGDVAGAGVDAGKKAIGGAMNMVGGAADEVSEGAGGILKWLLPLLLLGLLLLLGYWFCGKGNAPVTPGNANTNANKPANATANANTANANANVAPADPNAPKTLTEVVLPNGTKLQAYPGGIEDKLVKFIQSDTYKNATDEDLKKPENWFSFDDLNFIFGKTELTPESKRQLDNIVAILKAFPDVKMKIGTYTDKKGTDAANLKLSDARAKAVQAKFKEAGVAAQVPEAEGYGEKFAAVDENASDKEREKDRKTAVRLLKGDAKVSDASAKPANANTAPAKTETKPADANAKPATDAKAAPANAPANK